MCEECPATCDYCFKDLPSRKHVSYCVCVCTRACMCACMHACVRVCVCVADGQGMNFICSYGSIGIHVHVISGYAKIWARSIGMYLTCSKAVLEHTSRLGYLSWTCHMFWHWPVWGGGSSLGVFVIKTYFLVLIINIHYLPFHL